MTLALIALAVPSNDALLTFLETVIIVVLICWAIIWVLGRMGAPAIAIQIAYFVFGLIALFFLFGILRQLV